MSPSISELSFKVQSTLHHHSVCVIRMKTIYVKGWFIFFVDISNHMGVWIYQFFNLSLPQNSLKCSLWNTYHQYFYIVYVYVMNQNMIYHMYLYMCTSTMTYMLTFQMILANYKIWIETEKFDYLFQIKSEKFIQQLLKQCLVTNFFPD